VLEGQGRHQLHDEMCHKHMALPGLGTLFEVVPGVLAF
jgi:hypothetical protein